MTVTDRKLELVRVLNEYAFNSPECRPSQDTLAIRLGVTREYVNRLLRQLRDEGKVTWRRERRPGCRWEHNVYTLRDWSPPLRKRSLRNHEWIRSLKTRVHTEGNCKGYSSLSARSFPSVRNRTCNEIALGRVRGRGQASNQATTTGRVSLADCKRCEDLERLLKDAEQANVELGEMLAGAQLQLRRAGATEMALRRKLENERKEDDDWPVVKAVLEHWRTKTGHTRAVIDPAGDRAAVVRKALRSLTRGSEDQRLETVLLAIDGLALKPYVVNKRRAATGEQNQRYDQIEHALGNEKRIETLAAAARAARQLAQDEAAQPEPGPLWHWYERVRATAHAWAGLVVDAVVEREQEQLRQIEADRGYVKPEGFQAPRDALTGDMEAA